jgi:hypothetical protein
LVRYRGKAHSGTWGIHHYCKITFYWYGENKENTRAGNGIWHWGVKCYASKDLYNWEDKGIIIPPNVEDENSPLHPSQFMDRPHIIFNEKTGKFVCWLKIMKKEGTQESTVLISDHILGPYTIVKSGLRPLNMSAGDFDLVLAPDGKACYYFECYSYISTYQLWSMESAIKFNVDG